MERYLKKFLDELPSQTLFNELQVVLDHNEPTEQELIWVKDFQEKYPDRLKHIITNPVKPIGTSMNTCIKESDGKYLAIWNVDDLRTKNSLFSQVEFLENNEEYIACHGNFVSVNKFGSKIGKFVDYSPYFGKEYTRSMLLGPFFMWRKILNIKMDEQLKSGADFDFAIRLALVGKVGRLNGVLGYYLDEGRGASTNGNGIQQLERTILEYRYGILDKIDHTIDFHPKFKEYDIYNLYWDNEKYPIQKIIQNYDEFVKENGKP